jgi:uncharacterized membrane-anchored protein
LIAIKKNHSALHNGEHGATMIQVPNNNQATIFSFIRQDKDSKWFVVLNFSDSSQDVEFKEALYRGLYTNVFSDDSHNFTKHTSLNLPAWGFKVYKGNV